MRFSKIDYKIKYSIRKSIIWIITIIVLTIGVYFGDTYLESEITSFEEISKSYLTLKSENQIKRSVVENMVNTDNTLSTAAFDKDFFIASLGTLASKNNCEITLMQNDVPLKENGITRIRFKIEFTGLPKNISKIGRAHV